MEDSGDSDGDLVIDEGIMTNNDENELMKNDSILERTSMTFSEVAERRLNIFHPSSIISADMKDELFHEETNICNICNESFRYNIGLICHLEMEHVDLKINGQVTNARRKVTKKKFSKKERASKRAQNEKPKRTKSVLNDEFLRNIPKLKNADLKIKVPAKKSCEVCKKLFTDQNKLSKHMENCTMKFQCMYCKAKFGWESKYKKHLFRTHKLNAAVICKFCSKVYPDMPELDAHLKICDLLVIDCDAEEDAIIVVD